MNLDSSRRRARRTKPAPPTRGELRSQVRRTVREAVRASILDAAEDLIAKHGLHDAGLAQIARRAGVAVGTLYNYFTDRDALIRALFESRRAAFRPRLLAALSAGVDLAFEPRLRGFVRAVLEVFEAHRQFLKLAIEHEHVRPPGSTTPQDLLAAVTGIVAAGVREGAVPADRAELLPLAITATLKSIAIHQIQTGGELVAIADRTAAIMLDGVGIGVGVGASIGDGVGSPR